ncbi:hypothetical protein FRC01_001861 [Tulasnella sp. 417]|nr:hypothetical protein FRC01_001861 [Tulasnella sp. 417]
MTEILEAPSGFAVSPPFDSDSPGDCYFQATDGTRFKVLRHILIDTSPYFADLLKEMSPSTSPELPIFRIDEDAKTLHALLALLYPVHLPNLSSVALLLKLAEIRDKYSIPETKIAYTFSTVMGGLFSAPKRPVERAIELYSLAWRFHSGQACQFLSRHTHSVDLTDKGIIEKAVRSSKGIESFIALTELRRHREFALDSIVEAVEPKKYLCPSHSSSDQMFFTFISMIKTAAPAPKLVPPMLPKEPPGFAVSPPFDDGSPGDCYLQSIDGTRFKVLRHVLTDTSPYFADLMKEMPPSPSSKLPTLHIDEDTKTLHSLLALLYPVHVPDLLEAPLFLTLAENEEKYGIPESRLIVRLATLIRVLQLRGTSPVEGAIDLFSLTWRFRSAKACQFISRHTHSADLTDKDTVERLFRWSKSIESYIALVDLRRQRELALDDILEALEPRKHLCPSHSSVDKMFFAFIAMMKMAARKALLDPFPECHDAFAFLGLQGTDGKRASKIDQKTARGNLQISAGDINPYSSKSVERTMAEVMDSMYGYAVSPPFDSASPGDCYFRATDGTRFKVLRHVLVDASPYFADLLKEVSTSTSSELPTFDIDEDARTLHALLAFLYPVHVPDLLDGPLLLKLAEIEDKYHIPGTGIALGFSTAMEIYFADKTKPIERAIDLFSLAWRFNTSQGCRFISRHTHSVDLTNKSTVEKLISNSQSVESHIALAELRRQREFALDDIMEALEPKKHLCQSHSSSDKMFYTFTSMMKTAARNALLAPFPVCQDAFSFLGIQGTDGIRVVTWC